MKSGLLSKKVRFLKNLIQIFKMKLFKTSRLIIKTLDKADFFYFNELFTDSKILNFIPKKNYTSKHILNRFNSNLNLDVNHLKYKEFLCGIFLKHLPEMIGLAMFLLNDKGQREIGYRFRTLYWGNGYGTETANGIINYIFNQLNESSITADVNENNSFSIKISEKFMNLEKKFYSVKDSCLERRYALSKENWLENR